MHPITVATLSTGNPSLLTRQCADTLLHAPILVLRTQRHPIAAWLTAQNIMFTTLDTLHDSSEDFDAFNTAAASHLYSLATQNAVVYGVLDAGMDATVAALHASAPAGATIHTLAGISHADRCLAMLGTSQSGLRIYAAEDFREARMSPNEALLLCELHSQPCAGDCKLQLLRLYPEETPVTFFTGLLDGTLSMQTLPLVELDRQSAYDHLTACYLPAMPMVQRKRFDVDDLIAVMKRLRAPNGCPWDKEQTHESLLPYLLEECYEFIGAVREADIDHMYDELGDVLLQVVFHAEIARQHATFDIDDVTTAVVQKMVERHPHIFASVKAETSAQVLTNWDAIKRAQRGIHTTAEAMEDISSGLSATLRADKVQRKAAKVRFDFPDALTALAKVHEEAQEVADCLQTGVDPQDELGDLFFSIVNVCRLCKVNPDIALYAATNKFIDRFRKMEISIQKAGKSIEHLTLSEMDVYWEAEKQATPTIDG